MEALRKAFDLPGDAVRLRKSRCALVSQLGAFYVTSYHLCFIGGLGKKLAVPFSDLTLPHTPNLNPTPNPNPDPNPHPYP